MNGNQIGFIYFILSPDCEAVKIGFASDPEARLRHLNTAHHEALDFLILLPGTRQDEAYLHTLFQAKRLNREWFRHDHEMCGFIDDLCEAEWMTVLAARESVSIPPPK